MLSASVREVCGETRRVQREHDVAVGVAHKHEVIKCEETERNTYAAPYTNTSICGFFKAAPMVRTALLMKLILLI